MTLAMDSMPLISYERPFAVSSVLPLIGYMRKTMETVSSAEGLRASGH